MFDSYSIYIYDSLVDHIITTAPALLGSMFEEFRYNWSFKQVAAAVPVFALLAVWILFSSGAFSSGQLSKGVILSSGPVSVARVCGATQQVASVQLSKGRVVQALVASGGPLAAGTSVTLRQQSSLCNPTAYEIVAGK